MAQIFSQRPYNRFGAGVLEPNITNTLAYQQAGIPRQREMQQLVGMGLPFNTDISRVQVAGYGIGGTTPFYSAPRPQPFGTFGALSAGDVSGTGPLKDSEWRERQRVASAIKKAATTRNQQPELRPTQTKQSEAGTSGGPIAFTPFGRRVEEEISQTQTPRTSSPFPAGTIGSLTGFGGIPRFPFSNY